MSNTKTFLTQKGMEKLKKELWELENVKRQEVIKKIKEAKEYGDLSENSEYENAKNEQSFIEGRITDIERMLKNAVIIDERYKSSNKICLGSTVKVEVDGEGEEYTIVGSTESDPENGKISNESTVGQALIGKQVGEVVKVEVPDGVIEYKIKSIN